MTTQLVFLLHLIPIQQSQHHLHHPPPPHRYFIWQGKRRCNIGIRTYIHNHIRGSRLLQQQNSNFVSCYAYSSYAPSQPNNVNNDSVSEQDAITPSSARRPPRRRREMQAITKIVETREYPYMDGFFWKNNGNTVQKKTGNKSIYYKCSNSSKVSVFDCSKRLKISFVDVRDVL